jgi:RNA polymerase sigma factor, sigma-70 family
VTDFETIYNENFHSVYKYILSLCQNEVMAEEVTQETFYKAMESFDKFNGDCRIFVWLCQIAKNTYFTLYKKQKRLRSESDFDFSTQIAPDFENKYFDNEISKKLHLLLHQMDNPHKEVFTLRVFGELPFSQIGEIFGKTDSWARLVFYRAKNELRRKLHESEM